MASAIMVQLLLQGPSEQGIFHICSYLNMLSGLIDTAMGRPCLCICVCALRQRWRRTGEARARGGSHVEEMKEAGVFVEVHRGHW